MSDIIYRSDLDRDLTPNEVDGNFRSLNETKTETDVTAAIATDVELLNISQAQQDIAIAALGSEIEGINSSVAGLDSRLDAAESDLADVTAQTNATQQELTLHVLDEENPHNTTADQVGADTAGTAAATMQAHLAAADPHPQYLLPVEADALYDQLGAAAFAQANANAISIDQIPAVMAGAADGYLLKVTGTPGNEQVVAVPASSVPTPTQVAKRWFSAATEVIGPTTYNVGATAAPVGVPVSKTNTATGQNTENLIVEFVSNATAIGFTLDAGLWSFKLWDRASTAGNELRFKVFILNEVTFARTQVGPTYSYLVDNTVDELDVYELNVTAPLVINPGQRVVFSLYSFSNQNNRSVTVTFGGTSRESYLDLPLASQHNDLGGLQGGGGAERFHLTAAQAAVVANLEANPAAKSCTVQVLTTNSTYTKPPGAKSIHLLLIGAGQGGDSGAVGATNATLSGGKGGQGGARMEVELDASDFPSSCAVTVALGGIGGAASSGANTVGASGGDTSIVVGSTIFKAKGGSNVASSGLFPGGNGGASSSVNGTPGFAGNGGAPGGGSGGGISGGSSWNGGASAFSLLNNPAGTQPGGSGGVAPGGDGMNIPTSGYAVYKYPGVSGGGGASTFSADGGDGGDGGNYGAGGGGGGAAVTGHMSGAGGNGAPGVAIITTYF